MSSPIAMGRAVLCDDDALVRSVVRQVLASSAVEIVGEADSPDDALAAVREAGANILVLDLALRGGNGEQLLREIGGHADVHVVVFSAYVADGQALLDAGAAAVVEKPDFGRLRAAIDGVSAALGVPVERRRPGVGEARAPKPPPTATSLNGLEPWGSFLAAVDAATAGDALLCVDVVAGPSVADGWDHVLTTDHRTSLARMMTTSARRGPDRLSLTPGGRPMLLLVDAEPDAPASVFARIRDQWRRDAGIGRLVGAVGLLHDVDDPFDRLVRIEDAVAPNSPDPLRMV